MIVGACAAVMAAVPAPAADRDCPDFRNRAAAQTYFDAAGGSRLNNVDGLDRDRDGLACEDLPCPCAAPGQNGGSLAPGGIFTFRVDDPLDSTHSQRRSDIRSVIGVYDSDLGTLNLEVTLWQPWQPGDRVVMRLGSCQRGPAASGITVELFPQSGPPFTSDPAHAAFARAQLVPDVFSQNGLSTMYSIDQASPERQNVTVHVDALWHRWLGCLDLTGEAVEPTVGMQNTPAPEVDAVAMSTLVLAALDDRPQPAPPAPTATPVPSASVAPQATPTPTPIPREPSRLRITSAQLSRSSRTVAVSGTAASAVTGTVRVQVTIRRPRGSVTRSATAVVRRGTFKTRMRLSRSVARAATRVQVTAKIAGTARFEAAMARRQAAIRR